MGLCKRSYISGFLEGNVHSKNVSWSLVSADGWILYFCRKTLLFSWKKGWLPEEQYFEIIVFSSVNHHPNSKAHTVILMMVLNINVHFVIAHLIIFKNSSIEKKTLKVTTNTPRQPKAHCSRLVTKMSTLPLLSLLLTLALVPAQDESKFLLVGLQMLSTRTCSWHARDRHDPFLLHPVHHSQTSVTRPPMPPCSGRTKDLFLDAWPSQWDRRCWRRLQAPPCTWPRWERYQNAHWQECKVGKGRTIGERYAASRWKSTERLPARPQAALWECWGGSWRFSGCRFCWQGRPAPDGTRYFRQLGDRSRLQCVFHQAFVSLSSFSIVQESKSRDRNTGLPAMMSRSPLKSASLTRVASLRYAKACMAKAMFFFRSKRLMEIIMRRDLDERKTHIS